MVRNIQFIILATTKVGEKSLVLHTLSADWGRRSFIASVPKGGGMALFLPLNILDAEVLESPHSDLWRLRNISAAHPLDGIRSDLSKNSMTLFMSEVLYRTIKDGASEDGLYEWCRRSILTLDALEADYANYHLRFLLEFASALGFTPSAEDLMPFAGDCLKDLEALVSLDFSSFLLYPLKGERRNELAEILLKYLSYHTESAINVRSLSVLRELFA